VRSFPYLLATATSINLTNSLGVRLGVTVDVAVIIVVMARTVFLITCAYFLETLELPPPHLGHLLLEFHLERPPLYLGQILHCHADCVVRPDLYPGTTLLWVRHGFDKSVYITVKDQ
jgi:hypothetical protein